MAQVFDDARRLLCSGRLLLSERAALAKILEAIIDASRGTRLGEELRKPACDWRKPLNPLDEKLVNCLHAVVKREQRGVVEVYCLDTGERLKLNTAAVGGTVHTHTSALSTRSRRTTTSTSTSTWTATPGSEAATSSPGHGGAATGTRGGTAPGTVTSSAPSGALGVSGPVLGAIAAVIAVAVAAALIASRRRR